jgi:hypothetical protein
MARRKEIWEYGELTLLGVTPKGSAEPITNYSARIGGKEPIPGTDVDHFEVMNSFGAKGWRLRLVNEVTASSGFAGRPELLTDCPGSRSSPGPRVRWIRCRGIPWPDDSNSLK